MRSLLLIIILCCSIRAFAQSEPSDFGDVKASEFTETLFPDASSVILFEKTRFTYESRDYIYPMIERHLRVLIKKKEGIETWGDYALGDAREKYSKIRAATYVLENGKVVARELDKEHVIVDRKGSFEKFFSLPNLQEGCIIELSWMSIHFQNLSPSRVLQRTVPVLWSEYIIGGTRPLTTLIAGGIEPAIVDESYKSVYKRWVFKNLPAFETEPFMPAPRNHYARVQFFLPHENWTAVSKGFQHRHFIWYEKFQKPMLKKAAQDVTAGLTDDVEKIKALVTYMKNNFTWNGTFDFLASELTEVYNLKKGSVGDLNILLHIMLQEVGFKPTLVLLSTRSNGWVYKEIPNENQFNYILNKLEVNGKVYFLDATDPLLAFDALPEECINTDGFELVENTFNWIKVFPALRDKINVNARLTLSEDLTLKGRVAILSHGFEAREKRHSYRELGEQAFVKRKQALATWTIDSLKISNQQNLNLPFQEVYFASIPDRVTETPERVYIDPFILLVERENIWRSEERKFPIDLRIPTDKLLVVTLTLPPNWTVEELPPSQTITMPDNSISCSVKVTQSKNIVVTTYSFNTRRTLFAKEEYTSIRDFYNQVLLQQSRPIAVLKGKK
jgi:hypothetical protein